MTKIVAGLYASLNGVVSDPESWHYPYYNSPEVWQLMSPGVMDAQALLMGRRTYQQLAAIWSITNPVKPLNDDFNRLPKLVASSTLTTLDWEGSTLLPGDALDHISDIRKTFSGTVLVPGSPSLVTSLLSAGQIDELHVLIDPTVVERGRRLFDGIDASVRLGFAGSRSLHTGAVLISYEREPGVVSLDERELTH